LKCAVVTSTTPDIVAALDGLLARLKADLSGQRPDLVVTFFTTHHAGEAAVIGRRIREVLQPTVLLGCPAAGVIGEDVEVEERAGTVIWAAHWPGVTLTPFRLEVDEHEGEAVLAGWPDAPAPGTGFLVLADPYTAPGDALLEGFSQHYPGAPVLGGFSSGATGPGQAQFLLDEALVDDGVVGVAVGGSVRLDPLVSQGCRPVGRHLIITRAEQNVIMALGGKPALDQLRVTFGEVPARDQQLMQTALHVGRVVDERKSRFARGDLLVRNVLGFDLENKALAINDLVRAGQTIQFMVRDKDAASEDLRTLLTDEARRGPALGALLFSCNGRGTHLFGHAHHDVRSVHAGLGTDVATAGFFCNGEIGPVGGQPFLHGFTASVAIFRPAG
jgi:small ligand-binding sensory domain FIST